jgi:hypothetical protein
MNCHTKAGASRICQTALEKVKKFALILITTSNASTQCNSRQGPASHRGIGRHFCRKTNPSHHICRRSKTSRLRLRVRDRDVPAQIPGLEWCLLFRILPLLNHASLTNAQMADTDRQSDKTECSII